jgi:glyoxylase-like metal-dependent hydrolase (beta-lactamase superfamily II)
MTHYFSDHMAALRFFPKADILAHANYRETFDAERFRTPEEEARFVEPTIVIGDRLQLRWGAHTLDVFHNPGHTRSTLGVDIGGADLVHAADTIVGNIVYLAYGTAEQLATAVERLRRLGRSRVLTSHGSVRDARALADAATYLRNLEQRLAHGAREIDIAEVVAPGVVPTEFETVFHRRNLEALGAQA